MNYPHRGSRIRDAIFAIVAVVGLFALFGGVESPYFGTPGYFLITWFDKLEIIFGSAGAYFEVLFALYLLGIGVIGAIVAIVLRARLDKPNIPSWRFGVAGAFIVVGAMAILFGLGSLGPRSAVPALIAGVTALVLLGIAAWLIELLDAKVSE